MSVSRTQTPTTLRLPFIDGAPTPVADGDVAEIVHAATHVPLARVQIGGQSEADRAVAAAKRAQAEWSSLSRATRLATLERLADELDERAEDLAQTISAEVGTPIKLARRVQVGLPRTVLRSTLRHAADLPDGQELGNSLIVREPIGVVAAITPWNYPLHQAMAKVAPALAVGCTVVLKPASATPLHALLLADAAVAAGLPPGVLNVITGSGHVLGEHLAEHPDVDMVTFTGSTQAGRSVARVAAGTIKRVALELGGKSACVVLDDADLEIAIPAAVRNGLLNSGQTCSAWTRIIVPGRRQDEAVEIAAQAAARMRIGDPSDESVHLGPLINEAQRQVVLGHVEAARAAGLREVYSGSLPEDAGPGAFVAPHIFADVEPRHLLAQHEVFGPVLAIMPADDDDHAVELANSTIYGLAGAVFSADDERALAVARRLRTGQVDLNGAAFNPDAPFGGYRQSGNGRELGPYGVEEFLEIKAIQR